MNKLQSIDNCGRAEWGFHNPVKLIVGPGCRSVLVYQMVKQRLLIVTTPRGKWQLSNDRVLSALLAQNTVIWVDTVRENPECIDLQIEAGRLEGVSFDAIIAFGGGSAIDAAKVLNVMLAPECYEYPLLSLIANSKLHEHVKPKPLFAVATTAGTGSEVTPFATVWNREEKKKFSLVGPAVWPSTAIVDSELAESLPLNVSVSTGLDAINQAAESIWSKRANPITLGYASRALRLGFMALPSLAGGDVGKRVRATMAEASLLAGLAISHTRTSICHSISYPITAHFGVPHGLACAFTMPAVLRYNIHAEDGRFAQLALTLVGRADVNCLLDCFDTLHATMKVCERVKAYVPSLDDLLALEHEMFTPGRADNSLRQVSSLHDILHEAWFSDMKYISAKK